MKKVVVSFLSGTVIGAVVVTITGLILCEYAEGLPGDANKASE